MKVLLTLFVLTYFSTAYCQSNEAIEEQLEPVSKTAEAGSYQFIVDDIKAYQKTVPEMVLRKIEETRDDHNDITSSIEGYTVMIMSRDKWNAETRWPRYKLTH